MIILTSTITILSIAKTIYYPSSDNNSASNNNTSTLSGKHNILKWIILGLTFL